MLIGKKHSDKHQEEKYQFIQEQIRPQKKKKAIGMLRLVVMVIVLACLFGGIAGSIILLVQKQFGEEKESASTSAAFTSAPEKTQQPVTETDNAHSKGKMNLKQLNRLSERFAEIGEDAGASVVGVRAQGSTKKWLEEDSQTGKKLAYGLIVKETGTHFYIITTCDILDGQSTVEVQLEHDLLVKAAILGSDPQLNLAALRIKKEEIDSAVLEDMEAATLGSGLNLQKGTEVVAIGCPNGVLHSVVTGTITNDSIYAPITDGEVKLLSTSMPYSNTSNGVVLDLDSKVVGVISTEFVEETGTAGLSFVSTSSISELLNRLLRKESMPYLGCEGRSISEAMAKSHNMKVGAYITDVYSSSPAYTAGMRVADIITVLDGKKVEGMSDIYDILQKHKKGDTLKCTVSRKAGKKQVEKELTFQLS